jgi:alpha-amylase
MYRRFTPVDWISGSNIYEINVRQYTAAGTFNAFAEHLPRLRDMGIEILWFMPITPISKEVRQGTLGSYYACSDYAAINPEFGTLADFKRLVQEAHDLGFKVIIDWVANHTGWDHIWTKNHPEYFKRNSEGKFYDTNGWHDVIDLNFYDHNMRREMIAAMRFWIEKCGIDGFRCDMAHLVPLDFWRQARLELDQIKPLYWLAETEDLDYLDVFDSWYTWRWMAATEKYCRQEKTMGELLHILETYKERVPQQTLGAFFTTNHDENSWNGTEYEKYGGAAKTLAVFCCTWHGLPLIYSGQELPNRKRLKFFDKDPIEWNGRFELHSFYQTLLRLRREHPALQSGHAPEWISLPSGEPVLAYIRRNGDRQVIVVLNLSPNEVIVKLPEQYITKEFKDVFDGTKIGPKSSIIPSLKSWDFKVYIDTNVHK